MYGMPIFEQPDIHKLTNGTRVCLKLSVQCFNPGGHMVQTCIYKQNAVLEADLPEHVQMVAALKVRVHFDNRGLVLVDDERSRVLQLHGINTQDLWAVSELCAGIGGMTRGSTYSGFTVTGHCEQQAKFVSLLQAEKYTKVVHDDIGRLASIAAMHDHDSRSSGIAMGFSCQPWSSGGDQRGEMDIRAHTLAYGLYHAYIRNSSIVVLECVGEAPTYSYVKQCLDLYCQATGAVRSEVLLDLNQVWPSNRARWWCVLTHPMIGKIPIPGFPNLGRIPVVSDLFPQFMVVPDQLLPMLTLSQEELSKLAQVNADLPQCAASLHQVFPTALHSWGNQLIPCSCECRPAGLSINRLIDRGFFGTLIQYLDNTGQVHYRHPCPAEVAILVGMPDIGFVFDPRLELAALGQIASPIQSCWVFGAVGTQLQKKGLSNPDFGGTNASMLCLCKELFAFRDEFFPPSEHTAAMMIFQQQIRQLFGESAPGTSFPPNSEMSMTGSPFPEPGIPGGPQVALVSNIPGAVPGFGLGRSHASRTS